MTEKTKLALINFSGLVATAIARQENCKDVDWREIVAAQEALQTALQSELDEATAPYPPNAKLCDGRDEKQ